jgi:TolB-like protein/DNA-binding winged helix-turn-helix (wHTH) protein/Tfp pilus assembly protein PilF
MADRVLNAVSARIFRFDDWTLNLQSGELGRGSARTRLQEHPFQVLALLLETPGQVVTREQLVARLWPDTVVDFDTGLNTAVRKLRTALGDTADTPRYIETLPRRGYRFIGTVQEGKPVADATDGVVAPAGVRAVGSAGAAAPPSRGLLVKLAVPLMLVLAGLGAWLLRGGTLHRPAFTPPPHSVAVLPFVNMSGDATQEYFSDGLSEELLNALSRIDDLQVAAQTSSFYFKGKAADLDTIAHKLNVATVLEGSVRRSGHTVRITAQLVDAVSGFHLWSQAYDRNVDDALTLQSDIANAVASALKVTLLNSAATKTDLGGTRNPQALDAYLRGLKSFAATLRSGEEARETIAAFTEAIGLDPNFALAYTARSRTLVAYGSYFMIESTHEIFTKAQADATQAVTLEPDLGEAHAALAKALENGFLDFGAAAGEYERAMALSPGNVRVLLPYSRFASNMGRAEVAITTAQRAVGLDPLSMDAQRALGEAFENARRYPEALAAYEAAIKINPAHATQAYQRRGRLQYLMGDVLAAKASCEAEPDVYHLQTCMPLIYEKLGQHAAARAALAIAIESQKDFSSYQYAQIYAQWNQPDKAMDWLDRGREIPDPGVESVKTDPFLDPLRSLPRFQEMERALKFPP